LHRGCPIAKRTDDESENRAFIGGTARGDGLIPINANRLACIYPTRAAREQRMLYVDAAFFNVDDRSFIVIVHRYLECGASDGNNCRWGDYAIRVRLAPQMFDVHPNATDQDIQQVSPVP
jgi:hypothetical protein